MAPHLIRGASASKLASLASTEVDSRFPGPGLRGFPSVIQMEPTNYCNLRCPLCASGIRAFTRPTGMMDYNLFVGIMDELGRHLSLLVLWNWGEPFLNPETFEMIRHAKRKNIAVITSTNGQIIASTSSAKELVDSGLDTLAISLDGACQETYEQYRVGGSIDKVLTAIALIREAKVRACVRTPLVNVRVVVTSKNEREIPDIIRLSREHGADLVTLRSVSMPVYCGDGLDGEYAPEHPDYRMYRYDGAERQHPEKFICRRPWARVTVNWDGSVVGCEHDFDNSRVLGKFPEEGSMMQIVNSEAAKEFRGGFLADKNQYAFCAGCTFNDRVTDDCTVRRVWL